MAKIIFQESGTLRVYNPATDSFENFGYQGSWENNAPGTGAYNPHYEFPKGEPSQNLFH